MPFVIFIVYVLLSYVYPGEIFPALAPYRITYWVGLTGLGFATLWLIFKKSAPLTTVQLWFLVAFTVTSVISRMLAERWMGAVVPTLIQFGPSLAMFVLAICCIDSLRRLKIAAGWMVLLSLALVVQGVAAYHFGYKANMFLFDPVTRAEYDPNAPAPDDPEGLEDVSYTPDDQVSEGDENTAVRIRGLGLLHDPNDLALGLIMALPLLGAGWRRKANMRNLVFVILPAAALVYGLFLTRSRGGALALAVTLCFVVSRKVGRVSAALLFAVVIASGIASEFASGRQVSVSDESATGRVEAWTEGFEMLKAGPFLGAGFGQFLEHHELTAHNSFVLCFAETGLIGYFFWLGLLVITYVQLQSLAGLSEQRPIDRDIRQWARTLQSSMVGFLAAAFFLSRTFVPMLYLLLGLGVALIAIAQSVNSPVSRPSPFRLGTILVASEIGSILFIYVLVKVNLALLA
jgi:O-antigen ligase/polysaccharide polymerase Wzy-like membrane protein